MTSPVVVVVAAAEVDLQIGHHVDLVLPIERMNLVGLIGLTEHRSGVKPRCRLTVGVRIVGPQIDGADGNAASQPGSSSPLVTSVRV